MRKLFSAGASALADERGTKMNEIITGNNVEVLRGMQDEFIDLTVTSPPYDDLRTYNGYSFEFENLAKELYRVTKPGGVVVWVVGDATVKGSETCTSFKQALFFKEIGFNLHDTMIWNKQNCSSVGSMNRYENVFEYMFVFSKGKPKTANIIKDKPNKRAGEMQSGSIRQKDGTVRKTTNYGKKEISNFGRRPNVWNIFPAKSKKERLHPAPFSEQLANDHILSWSNPGDIVLDPFGGSGTTAKMSKKNGRQFIHIDISDEYNEISRRRVNEVS
jgi:site-specific DNA-methyltransferase (adenine-specific)